MLERSGGERLIVPIVWEVTVVHLLVGSLHLIASAHVSGRYVMHSRFIIAHGILCRVFVAL
jgi:hypothetical protein